MQFTRAGEQLVDHELVLRLAETDHDLAPERRGSAELAWAAERDARFERFQSAASRTPRNLKNVSISGPLTIVDTLKPQALSALLSRSECLRVQLQRAGRKRR